MNTLRANVDSIRSKRTRKHTSVNTCLIFCLLISCAACELRKEDDAVALNDSDYIDADDIEWGNLPIAETTTKGHPVVYYKEDIVSEDYDPNKDSKSALLSKEVQSQLRGRYKDINRRNRLNRTENYRYIKPEKVYFDVYPSEYDRASNENSKFNDVDIDVEAISPLGDESKDDQGDSLQLKSNIHKKIVRHHRQRRDIKLRFYKNWYPKWCGTKKTIPHVFYNNVPDGNANVRRPTPRIIPPTMATTTTIPSIGNRIDDDDSWRVWAQSPITEKPRKTKRPLPPIIHSGDEDYTSNSANAPMTTTYRPETTTRPRRTTMFPRTPFQPTTTTTRPAPAPPAAAPSRQSAFNLWKKVERTLDPAPAGTSPCFWAVTTCCNKRADIQLKCFEYLGCIGEFWDVDPCSDEFVRSVINTVRSSLDN